MSDEPAPETAPQQDPDTYCFNCAFFNSEDWTCRRYAPRAGLNRKPARELRRLYATDESGERLNAPLWPRVVSRDWCGEFEVSSEVPDDGWMVHRKPHPQDD